MRGFMSRRFVLELFLIQPTGWAPYKTGIREVIIHKRENYKSSRLRI